MVLRSFFPQDRRYLADRGSLKNGSQAKLPPKRLLNSGDHLHRQKGMPAQLKKLVLNTDRLHLEHSLPDLHQARLYLIGRAHVLLLRIRTRLTRLRQRMPVHLSVGIQRQGSELNEGRRQHVIWKPLHQKRT
ncbi:hypothetical protein SDC9_145094 [bioreactor metagenome]|uniref:Uncharacterized protein n=1 Tax=bioreactor metagenome TaxID=1076179 RepID=A0A645E7M2_9ZZZZ